MIDKLSVAKMAAFLRPSVRHLQTIKSLAEDRRRQWPLGRLQ